MGLKCSMFGHSFGDPEVEREREENGDEVVVTVREVKVCSRCGAESVVSENKEVTSIREPPTDDADATPEADDAPATAPADAGEEAAPNLDAVEDEGAELLGEDDPVFDDPDDADAEAADADGAADADADAEEPDRPSAAVPIDDEPADADDEAADDEAEPAAVVGEDATIVDAETGEPAGESDEEAPVADPEDLLPKDAVEATDEGEEPPAADAPADADDAADAEADEAADDDGVILDEAESEPGPERSRGEWPDSGDVGPPTDEAETDTWPDDAGGAPAEGAGTDAEGGEGGEAGAVETGIASAGRAPAADEPNRADDAELFCPSCSYSASLERASLRVGDICPECKRGYLSER
jgi:hypothetical protein